MYRFLRFLKRLNVIQPLPEEENNELSMNVCLFKQNVDHDLTKVQVMNNEFISFERLTT